MLTVSRNIKTLLQHFGVTNASIAKEIGVDKSTLTRWFTSDSSPRSESVKAIADIFGIPVSMLYEVPVEFEKDIELIKKPEAVYEVSAGSGRINDGYETASSSVDDSELVRICGDSMLPTLHDGDIVRVIPATETTQEEYTIVKINGDEATCKHVEITDTGIWLRGENKDAYTDTFYTVQQVLTLPVQVVGKATAIVQRKL